MGTRHLIAVVVDGEYKVAQYGQWDGYPSGQGYRLLDFLRSANLSLLAQKARAARKFTEEDEQALIAEGKSWTQTHPHMSRDTGADIVKILLQSRDGLQVYPAVEFAADSLFCEWGYVIDLDKGLLEVYRGFNKTPLDPTERFAFLAEKAQGGYQPIKHVHSFSLDRLPDNEIFQTICEPPEPESDV